VCSSDLGSQRRSLPSASTLHQHLSPVRVEPWLLNTSAWWRSTIQCPVSPARFLRFAVRLSPGPTTLLALRRVGIGTRQDAVTHARSCTILGAFCRNGGNCCMDRRPRLWPDGPEEPPGCPRQRGTWPGVAPGFCLEGWEDGAAIQPRGADRLRTSVGDSRRRLRSDLLVERERPGQQCGRFCWECR
jgi:hypothetical protein